MSEYTHRKYSITVKTDDDKTLLVEYVEGETLDEFKKKVKIAMGLTRPFVLVLHGKMIREDEFSYDNFINAIYGSPVLIKMASLPPSEEECSKQIAELIEKNRIAEQELNTLNVGYAELKEDFNFFSEQYFLTKQHYDEKTKNILEKTTYIRLNTESIARLSKMCEKDSKKGGARKKSKSKRNSKKRSKKSKK